MWDINREVCQSIEFRMEMGKWNGRLDMTACVKEVAMEL